MGVDVDSFTDVSKHDYYYDATSWAVDNGITTGQTSTTFAPDAPCTREQVITFLYRVAGSPEISGTGTAFSDVSADSYAYDAILWAIENGITTGITPDTFGGSQTVSREQLVTLLFRAAGSPEPTITENPFTDVSEDSYSYQAILWAVENGITTGMSETTFAPTDDCTRGQTVTFIYRDANK
jgi:hypothetical protein